MTIEYENIENRESSISELLKGKFLKERILFGEMMELLFEALTPLSGYIQGTAEGEMALLTIGNRMFNNCEGAKQLLLWGLPDQASPLIRDIIECSLQFRLFITDPKAAKKWLLNSGEYSPGNIHAKLLESSVDAKEYAFYGLLSHESHSNLLACLSHVQETPLIQEMLRVFHFGSAWTPETEYCIQENFLMLFFLMHIALVEPLAEFYYNNSKPDLFTPWCEKIDKLFPKLEALNSEIHANKMIKAIPVDPIIQELVNKKMRFEKFKKILNKDPEQ